MATFTEDFFSIVILGRMNPAILNHDFLVENDIIPKTVQPFSTLLQEPKGKQFTEFISTPVMSSIKYGQYSILVESQRLQAIDETGSKPHESVLLGIVKKYFGVLEHTPVKLGGFNFRGKLVFANRADERQFDERLGIDYGKIEGLTQSPAPRAHIFARWPYEDGNLLLQLNKQKDINSGCSLQLNFEFEYIESMDAFLERFDVIKKCHDEFARILSALGI